MPTPVTGVRIPLDLLAQIDALAVDGKSRTDIILQLIQSGLGKEPPAKESDCLTEIRASLIALNTRLTLVEQRSTKKPSAPKVTLEKTREDASEGGSDEVEEGLALGLSERELSRRFGIDRTGITNNRNNPERLAAYSRTRDPEGIAWEFRDGRYFPMEDQPPIDVRSDA
jgi:hypothetical protein